MEDFNKPLFRPRFQSEFSMGEYDFKRYDVWLGRAESSSANINSCEIPSLEMIQRYFAELNVLYKCWRSLISSIALREDLDTQIKSAITEKRNWENAISSGIQFNKIALFKIIDSLDSIHTKLLDIKQIIGLGIVVKRVMTTKEKIRRGIKPLKNYNNLPEA